jgi:hypothetical protein
LQLDILPNGYTYGNPESKDAVFAKLLANKLEIKHKIITPPNSTEWYAETYNEIINLGNSDINVHRAHRLLTIKNIAEDLGHNTSFYGGYLGGEFLMGIYYDNLIFPAIITNTWENNSKINYIDRLKKYFHRIENSNILELEERLKKLNSLNEKNTKEQKQFHALFELGIPHYAQDLFLASQHLKFPYPFFIDIEFLDLLFKSKYSFLYMNSNSKNPLKRYSLYKLNLSIQHLLYPKMDTIPFAKQGTYNTKEY